MNSISDFRESVWFLLNDDIDEPEHSEEAVDRNLRQVLLSGLVPGYTLAPDRVTVVPEIYEPTAYLLLSTQAAWAFVRAEPEFLHTRTRPYTETSRKSQMLQLDLQQTIYELKNGSMFFAGWQSLYTWLVGVSGFSGRDIGNLLTRLNVDVPIGQVTVTAGGITST